VGLTGPHFLVNQFQGIRPGLDCEGYLVVDI